MISILHIYIKISPLLTGEDEELAEAEKALNGGKDQNGQGKDFKSHLNNLYNGLAKIMSTTCQVEKEETPKAPFAVEKAVHNIIFIKHHMKRQDEFDAVSQLSDQFHLLSF